MHVALPKPEDLISCMLKCNNQEEAIEFAEYLCTISDSKLVFDCCFELIVQRPDQLKNFLQVQEDRKLLGQSV